MEQKIKMMPTPTRNKDDIQKKKISKFIISQNLHKIQPLMIRKIFDESPTDQSKLFCYLSHDLHDHMIYIAYSYIKQGWI